ncbi:hypothetical protein CLAFUW4_10274 [Fulvia fulva]|nr:hypothetical protein CLAFUR4_10278 [Fulvia fulva]KAK4616458.1 hypothetical protein CLAFUR0_10276 [Fulvia fulva]WPV19354.1 hypothetical protein CLAFUW4_10274 [Fulvia fulva]WPV34643.1 hypothetical protein CLAFUW7_10274 [Fulvia fulva]
MAAQHVNPNPPTYDHALAALPTRAELLTMTPAQVEHQERIERLEHDRKVRQHELRRLESGPAADTAAAHAKAQAEAEARRTYNNLLNQVSTIVNQGWNVPGTEELSKPAKKLSSLLCKILNADYLNGTNQFDLCCCSWNTKHLHAVGARGGVTNAQQDRIKVVRDAAQEPNLSYDLVKALMLQYSDYQHSSWRYTNSLAEHGRWEAVTVKIWMDAYTVVPVVAKNDRDAAMLLDGIIKKAKWVCQNRRSFDGYVKSIEDRAADYRARS